MRFDLPNFRVDFRDWNKGNNLYDDIPTGGLKRDAVGYNPFKAPGALYSMPTRNETSITASLKRRPFLAWAVGSDNPDLKILGVGIDVAALTGGQGHFYYMDEQSGAMTLEGSGHATNYKYTLGQTEAINFNSGVLITSDIGATFFDPAAGSPFNIRENYNTALGLSAFDSIAPHPMAKLEGLIYIGDGDQIHQIDGLTGTDDYLELPQYYTISSLEEHRGNLVIAATFQYIFAGQLQNVKTVTEIFLWPGYGESFVDRFYIPDLVTTMKSDVDGRLYVWTLKQFGYFNGLRFVPLRDLTTPVYRNHVIPCKNGIMFAEGTKIIRYASVLPGGTRYFFTNEIHTLDIASIATAYPDLYFTILDGGSGNAGRNMLVNDITSSGGTREVEFNPRITKVPVKVRQVVIETDGLGASGVITVKYKNSNGETKTCGTFTYADATMAAKKRWTFNISSHVATTQIIPLITVGGTAKLLSVDYYYEAAQETNNS